MTALVRKKETNKRFSSCSHRHFFSRRAAKLGWCSRPCRLPRGRSIPSEAGFHRKLDLACRQRGIGLSKQRRTEHPNVVGGIYLVEGIERVDPHLQILG